MVDLKSNFSSQDLLTIFTGISSQDWSTIFTGIQTFVIIISIYFALKSLKIMAKTHKLEAIDKFTNEIESFKEDRQFLYTKFNFDSKKTYKDFELIKVKNVINSINRISMLIDNKIIAEETVFALCHTMIIRCEYKLKPYLEYQESKLGARYGRRIIRLSDKAKRYHTCHKHHRINSIKIFDNVKEDEIFRTSYYDNFILKYYQKFSWLLRRKFNYYK